MAVAERWRRAATEAAEEARRQLISAFLGQKLCKASTHTLTVGWPRLRLRAQAAVVASTGHRRAQSPRPAATLAPSHLTEALTGALRQQPWADPALAAPPRPALSSPCAPSQLSNLLEPPEPTRRTEASQSDTSRLAPPRPSRPPAGRLATLPARPGQRRPMHQIMTAPLEPGQAVSRADRALG